MNPTLSILIRSTPDRQAVCERLLRILMPQLDPSVEVIVNDVVEMNRGQKCQTMIQEARGQFVAFVDSDDLPADDYVARVLKGCDEDKDCCSLTGLVTTTVGRTKPFHHSIKNPTWREDANWYYRSINHLNAVRREIALAVGFPLHMDHGEDAEFSRRLLPLLKTEADIPGVLYHYFAGDEIRRVAAQPRILFKWPTRARPKLFRQTMTEYMQSLSGCYPVEFVISVDEDDPSASQIKPICDELKAPATVVHGPAGRTKIEAINADIAGRDFDILVVIADDMIPNAKNFDDWIVADMAREFPSLDGMVLYDDGYQRTVTGRLPVATMPVMGRRFFEAMGQVYEPSYKSLFCDNELTEVAAKMGKASHVARIPIRHEWIGRTKNRDALLIRNEAHWGVDRALFERRRKMGFR